MNIEEVIKNLDMCFTSGNEIPVSRATIKKEEWEVIKKELRDLKQDFKEQVCVEAKTGGCQFFRTERNNE